MTREIPLLCTDEVVRAYLVGRKTQTRRPITWAVNQVGEPADHLCQIGTSGRWIAWWGPASQEVCRQMTDRTYPPHEGLPGLGQPGDRVWIRECWAPAVKARERQIAYRADGRWGSCSADHQIYWHGWVNGVASDEKLGQRVGRSYFGKWRPNIHMKRQHARIVLPVVSVRAERVRDISEADAMAEGVERLELTDGILPDVPPPFNRVHPMTSSYRDAYQALWRSLYGTKHPPETAWCWAIETELFKGASK